MRSRFSFGVRIGRVVKAMGLPFGLGTRTFRIATFGDWSFGTETKKRSSRRNGHYCWG